MAITYIYPGADLRIIDVEIASGASVSDVFEVPAGMAVVGLYPGAWTAADIAFKVAALEGEAPAGPILASGGTGYIKCAVTASTPIAFPSTDAICWPYVQLLSCTANNAADVTPVAQGAKRTIRLIIRSLFR